MGAIALRNKIQGFFAPKTAALLMNKYLCVGSLQTELA
jgi:hypothetical protein